MANHLVANKILVDLYLQELVGFRFIFSFVEEHGIATKVGEKLLIKSCYVSVIDS